MFPRCLFCFLLATGECGTTHSTGHHHCLTTAVTVHPLHPISFAHLDEYFLFKSLVVGLPYSSIFWQFWLYFVLRLVVILLMVVREVKYVYLCLHLDWKSDFFLIFHLYFSFIPATSGTHSPQNRLHNIYLNALISPAISTSSPDSTRLGFVHESFILVGERGLEASKCGQLYLNNNKTI